MMRHSATTAVPAPADHLIQLMAESRQIGELAIDLGQVLSGNRVYRGTGPVPLIPTTRSGGRQAIYRP